MEVLLKGRRMEAQNNKGTIEDSMMYFIIFSDVEKQRHGQCPFASSFAA